MRSGGVESGASIYVRVLSLYVLVRVPLTDILNSSPQASVRALCARVEALLCWSSFRGVARATPTGVAPEPLEESLTPSRVMLRNPTEALLMFIMEEELESSIGWFSVAVVTYSRWSERHLPQIELLSGNPSENLCPIRGGQL